MIFAVLIPSHGRADRVVTVKTLRSQGYTGEIFIVCDDLDETIGEYRARYGDHVIVFNKREYAEKTDTLDNFGKMNVVVYARNALHDIARELGLTHFLVLDDDYTEFDHRYVDDGMLKGIKLRNLDKVFNSMCEFLDVSGALTIAFAQGGDFIGGIGNDILKKGLKRKAMNSFFMRTDRPFKYMGTINEDANAYVLLGSQGKLFLTVADVSLNQGVTQQNSGGLTEVYLDLGTYVKSFYTVIVCPSFTTVKSMGNKFRRLHHSIRWDNAVPQIIPEEYKKR